MGKSGSNRENLNYSSPSCKSWQRWGRRKTRKFNIRMGDETVWPRNRPNKYSTVMSAGSLIGRASAPNPNLPIDNIRNTQVKTVKMHLFTFIQMMCLIILWVVKSTKASLAFPFFLILMVPLRAQLKHVFSAGELRALDGDQPEGDDDEPDFYAEAPLPG